MEMLGSKHASDPKQRVHDYWNAGSCGEVYAQGETLAAQYEEHARERYRLEPYIMDFARFADGAGRDVLEIGVGMGADHLQWARSRPRSLTGVDLTPRAVEHTRDRLAMCGFEPAVQTADAESLPFPDESFDLVYSWGVIHHSPDTRKAAQEIFRVLRPGGVARVMIYHKRSIVGALLWLRYGLLVGRPGRTLADVYSEHLESPGTKAFTVIEAESLFGSFTEVSARSQLAFGDLLEGAVGQRHQSGLLSVGKKLWPRWFIRRFMARYGLMLLVEAVK